MPGKRCSSIKQTLSGTIPAGSIKSMETRQARLTLGKRKQCRKTWSYLYHGGYWAICLRYVKLAVEVTTCHHALSSELPLKSISTSLSISVYLIYTNINVLSYWSCTTWIPKHFNSIASHHYNLCGS